MAVGFFRNNKSWCLTEIPPVFFQRLRRILNIYSNFVSPWEHIMNDYFRSSWLIAVLHICLYIGTHRMVFELLLKFKLMITWIYFLIRYFMGIFFCADVYLLTLSAYILFLLFMYLLARLTYSVLCNYMCISWICINSNTCYLLSLQNVV